MYRIMIIEDDFAMRTAMQDYMASKRFEVASAANVALGLKACSQQKPDLILLDVNLPDGNGIELCRKLKSDPQLRHIPVLILTGEASSVENRVEGLQAGADDYILKPFGMKELALRVERILKSGARPTSA